MKSHRNLSNSLVCFSAILLLLSPFLAAQTAPALSPAALPASADTLPAAGKKGGQARYVLLSLIIPGAGEWAMGHKGRGKFFIGTEITFWLGLLGSMAYTDALQNDLEAFSAVHAGVNTAGKSDQYWIDVGSAANIFKFNQQRLLDRDIEATYPEGAGFDWQWDSEASRKDYLDKRFRRLDWKRTTTVAVVAVVLNHLVSAIDVIRLVRKENSREAERRSLLRMNYTRDRYQGDQVRLNLSMRF